MIYPSRSPKFAGAVYEFRQRAPLRCMTGEQPFSRLDFAIGVDPATDPTERIAAPLIIQWTITVKKT